MYSKEQNETILKAFRDAVQSTYGARAVSEAIGRKYPTFMREVSPYDKNAKLGFMDAIEIFKFVEDDVLMDAIEKQLGVRIQIV